MKTIKIVLGIFLIFLITSCAKTTRFPNSSVTPGAEIMASKKKDKNGNYMICVKAKHLVSSERLTPPKKTYVVWITTNSQGLKNIGQLKSKNGSKAMLQTSSSFDPLEIFITAEHDGNITTPGGVEISRAAFK